MSISNEPGAVYLNNKTGDLVQVGTLTTGITLNLFKTRPLSVTRVSIQAGMFSDEFFFQGSELLFHHIASSDHPGLTQHYLEYFLSAKNVSAGGFLKYVVRNYFVKELGCQYSASQRPAQD